MSRRRYRSRLGLKVVERHCSSAYRSMNRLYIKNADQINISGNQIENLLAYSANQ